MYINKVKAKIFNIFNKNKKIIKAVFLKIINKSDYSRWQDQKALFSDWNERTKLLAHYIKPNSTVFEFGAARLELKNMLPEGCVYLHSDLVARAEDTLVADLNKGIPDIPEVDVIVFSGVLEYIFDVEQLLVRLSPKTKAFVFSYATVNRFPKTSKRREYGWVSDLSEEEFKIIASKLNKNLIHLSDWKSQHLFKVE